MTHSAEFDAGEICPCSTPGRTHPVSLHSAENDAPLTPEERATKREAAIQGLVAKGYTRERSEELIDMIGRALFAPGKRFGRSVIPSGKTRVLDQHWRASDDLMDRYPTPPGKDQL